MPPKQLPPPISMVIILVPISLIALCLLVANHLKIPMTIIVRVLSIILLYHHPYQSKDKEVIDILMIVKITLQVLTAEDNPFSHRVIVKYVTIVYLICKKMIKMFKIQNLLVYKK